MMGIRVIISAALALCLSTFLLNSCEEPAQPLASPEAVKAAAESAQKSTSAKTNKSKKGKKKKWAQYQTDAGVSLEYPGKWQAEATDKGQKFVSPKSGKKDRFQESLEFSVEKLASAQPANAYLKTAEKNLSKLLEEFKVTKRGKLKTGKGKPKVEYLHYTYREGKKKRRGSLHVAVKGTEAYVFTGSATPKSFKKFRSRFDAVAKSLTLPAH